MEALVAQYDTADLTLNLAGQPFRLTCVADLEALLARLDPVTFAEDERLPYWAELWPSAVALADYLLRRLCLAGKRVLELGCGLGLVSLVAARQGARVLGIDYEPAAIAFARHNARRNACRHARFRLMDWRYPALRRRYDCILAADVLYEARHFGALLALLWRALARGGLALFAEPGRPQAAPFFALLRQHGFTCTQEVVPLSWQGGEHQIGIHTVRFSPR
ncbi:MAG: type 12 methyltransferase [Candidatus Tectimicrobiota bacterium]|nr:MAG: type 12 methyltransferase [Candidatus Tectomicrobia bacterium]